jgi:AraC-like DNA-binding protein
MGVAVPRHLFSRSPGPPIQEGAEQARESLDASAPPAEPLSSLRHLLISLLPDGYPRLERTAEVLVLTARTLQQQLAELGLTYTRLVEQARLEIGRTWLQDSDRSVTQIALNLGYRDASNFTRAFRRWASVAPSAWRRAWARENLQRPATLPGVGAPVGRFNLSKTNPGFPSACIGPRSEILPGLLPLEKA